MKGANVFFKAFLGKSPYWYKLAIASFLIINPIVYFFISPFIASFAFVSNSWHSWATGATLPSYSESWKHPGVYWVATCQWILSSFASTLDELRCNFYSRASCGIRLRLDFAWNCTLACLVPLPYLDSLALFLGSPGDISLINYLQLNYHLRVCF